ncbi:MAG: YddF family protein [Candidatus Omnitrophica bacterium]|nr:YddF family protein [Candidatus Omnitrophota bacterium]
MKLVNFAIMQNEGIYKLKELTKEEFVNYVRKNEIESYISFYSTAEVLEKLTNKDIKVNKKRCYIDDKETYLIVVLKEQKRKGKRLTADDFKYFYCEYSV